VKCRIWYRIGRRVVTILRILMFCILSLILLEALQPVMLKRGGRSV